MAGKFRINGQTITQKQDGTWLGPDGNKMSNESVYRIFGNKTIKQDPKTGKLNFDWDQYNEDPTYDEEENLKSIKIVMPEETYNMWLKWKDRVKSLGDYETDSKAFEFAIIEALNGTTEEI